MTHEQTTPTPVEVTQADIDAVNQHAKNKMCFGETLEEAFARHRIAHSAPAGEVEPVAWMYRWKADGEYVNWRYSDASNYHKSLDGYEEKPLYTRPAPPAELITLLHQYRSDLLRPPAPDSRERRIVAIDAAIAKFGRNA